MVMVGSDTGSPVNGGPNSSVEVLAAEPLSVSLRHFEASGLHETIATAHVLIASPEATIAHRVDGALVSAGPGTAIHIRPGQAHGYVRQPAEGWAAVITDPTPWPPATGSTVDLGRSHELVKLLFLVLTEPIDLPRPYVDRVVDACATALLTLVRNQAIGVDDVGPTSSYQRITEDFRRAVELGFAADRSVSSYARQIGCSSRTLTRATMQTLARTPREIIDERIGLAAARLLTMSDTSVSNISHALGFTTPSNFARFFRRVMGEAPTAYRGRHRDQAEGAA
jgi:AraC-like DNA-binding protein